MKSASADAVLPAAARWERRDIALLVGVTALAFLLRWPYWRTIPAAGDETTQAIQALNFISGAVHWPLTGRDAYTGPFFVYLLAALFRLGVADPLVGRLVMLTAGTLIVPLVYAWARDWGARWLAALLAGMLAVANPHLIVLNSHIGGATFLIPFFTTLCFWLMTRALVTDRPGWWLGAAVAGGLAVQVNLVSALPVLAAGAWFAYQARSLPRLGRHWLRWLLAGGLTLLVVESPVVAFNLINAGRTVTVLEARSYLWESNPTLLTYAQNLVRLALQVARQQGGVLSGDETLASLKGAPMVLAAWSGLAALLSPRRVRSQLAAIILPYAAVMPYFSGHFGMLEPVRFTTFMTPALAVGMALGIERGAVFLAARAAALRAPAVLWLAAFGVALLSLQPLRAYYRQAQPEGRALEVVDTLAREMVAGNRGEVVYMAYSPEFARVQGVPYIPRAYLLMAGIPETFIPADQIVGRLFVAPGPAMLFLHDHDLPHVRPYAALIPWPSAANAEARRLGFGLYTLDAARALKRPDFVLTGAAARAVAPQVPLGLTVGGGLKLLGYDLEGSPRPGQELDVILYWQAEQAMPPADYQGFVHLVDSADAALAVQVDQPMGQTVYPVNAWRPGEIIADGFRLLLPADLAPGAYSLQVGVYRWPSLERLPVPGWRDNVIVLKPVAVAP